MSSRVFTGKNAESNFLENILRGEEEILAVPKQMKMTRADWEEFKTATNCHICGKSLVKEEFLDSLPVWQLDEGIDAWSKSNNVTTRTRKQVFTR